MSNLLDSDRHSTICAVAYAMVKDAITIHEDETGGEAHIDADECNRLTLTFFHKASDEELYGIIRHCIINVEGNRTCLSFSLSHAIYHWLNSPAEGDRVH